MFESKLRTYQDADRLCLVSFTYVVIIPNYWQKDLLWAGSEIFLYKKTSTDRTNYPTPRKRETAKWETTKWEDTGQNGVRSSPTVVPNYCSYTQLLLHLQLPRYKHITPQGATTCDCEKEEIKINRKRMYTTYAIDQRFSSSIQYLLCVNFQGCAEYSNSIYANCGQVRKSSKGSAYYGPTFRNILQLSNLLQLYNYKAELTGIGNRSCLGSVVVGRQTSGRNSKDHEFDSRPVHCRVTQVNSAFHPSGVGKQSTGLLAGVKAGRIHLCRVAGNTV